MEGTLEEFGAGGAFDYFSEVHYGHDIAEEFDYGQVMGDEQVREAELVLKVF